MWRDKIFFEIKNVFFSFALKTMILNFRNTNILIFMFQYLLSMYSFVWWQNYSFSLCVRIFFKWVFCFHLIFWRNLRFEILNVFIFFSLVFRNKIWLLHEILKKEYYSKKLLFVLLFIHVDIIGLNRIFVHICGLTTRKLCSVLFAKESPKNERGRSQANVERLKTSMRIKKFSFVLESRP